MRDLFNNIIIIPKWKTKGYFETWKKIISIEHASNQWDSYVFSILKKNVDLLLNFFSFIHAISNNNQAIYIQHIPYMHIKSKETIFRHEMRNSLLNKKKTTGTYQPKSQINNNKISSYEHISIKIECSKVCECVFILQLRLFGSPYICIKFKHRRRWLWHLFGDFICLQFSL